MAWNCNQYAVGKCKVSQRLRGALAVIHTWATFQDGVAFDRQHVADLCKKVIAETDALKSVKPTVKPRKRRGYHCEKCGKWFGWYRHYVGHMHTHGVFPEQETHTLESIKPVVKQRTSKNET